jgi:hypothetical protein
MQILSDQAAVINKMLFKDCIVATLLALTSWIGAVGAAPSELVKRASLA